MTTPIRRWPTRGSMRSSATSPTPRCRPRCAGLGCTIRRWRDLIVAWHRCQVSNGPTEAVNNLVKRVQRVAFGMPRFRNYRIRALLYAGRPHLDLAQHHHPTMNSDEPDHAVVESFFGTLQTELLD